MSIGRDPAKEAEREEELALKRYHGCDACANRRTNQYREVVRCALTLPLRGAVCDWWHYDDDFEPN